MKNRGFEVCSKYENCSINLPIRKTMHSVGYDLEASEDIVIKPVYKSWLQGTEVKPTLVRTGIKSYFNEDEVLILANKSSNPIKKDLLWQTVLASLNQIIITMNLTKERLCSLSTTFSLLKLL